MQESKKGYRASSLCRYYRRFWKGWQGRGPHPYATAAAVRAKQNRVLLANREVPTVAPPLPILEEGLSEEEDTAPRLSAPLFPKSGTELRFAKLRPGG